MSHRELPTPPVATATDPVQSAADLRQRWRALMGPLGFGEKLLWFAFVGPDRRLTKVLSQVPIGPRPQGRMLRKLMSALRTLLDDMASKTTVALLLTGPGRGPISTGDRVWAKSLTETAERFGVPLEPIFRANDEALVQIDGHTNRTTPLPDGIACFREPKRRHSK
ncbi:hypothetical protein MXEN_07586 [Mycobacterium xenopi RIVM700367]|uniref:Uncharacterized protein n=2 Tax=Mycobacterium xenopi TaxID=1789 RepID=A0AAD1H0U3_MYCXE|nr:hypothetical protein MXEN_07586 [Mycobacterium xenopi RIVM700367]BBU23008.1 hypothetical protein MYXE_27980 [Mycobacterium xenopi]SPX88663.1 Uncharacterised protein [Mycobacterium xenopi]